MVTSLCCQVPLESVTARKQAHGRQLERFVAVEVYKSLLVLGGLHSRYPLSLYPYVHVQDSSPKEPFGLVEYSGHFVQMG